MRGWLHVGAVLVLLVAGPILISNARSTGSRVALTVYVASLLTLFGVSSLLHRGHWGPKGTRRMRRADHSTIFVGIAGSYSAVAELALSGTVRVVVLALVWGGAVVGILIRQLLLDAPQWVVALPYVVVGWSALAVTPQLVRGAAGPGSSSFSPEVSCTRSARSSTRSRGQIRYRRSSASTRYSTHAP